MRFFPTLAHARVDYYIMCSCDMCPLCFSTGSVMAVLLLLLCSPAISLGFTIFGEIFAYLIVFFFCVPQLYVWDSPFLVKFLRI